MNDRVPRETAAPAPAPASAPAPPAEAETMFGDRLALARRYADWLADAGTVRGVIGPRETPRLWERHLLNCAAVADLIPTAARVADLGSGGGLPGLVLAVRRPDLLLTLVEPLQRRTDFLGEVIADLDLSGVEVVRGRAEELHGRRHFDVVTSRALAPLDRLLRWSWPLVVPGGALLAMKGSSAAREVAECDRHLSTLGRPRVEILTLGEKLLVSPTTVLRVESPPPPG